ARHCDRRHPTCDRRALPTRVPCLPRLPPPHPAYERRCHSRPQCAARSYRCTSSSSQCTHLYLSSTYTSSSFPPPPHPLSSLLHLRPHPPEPHIRRPPQAYLDHPRRTLTTPRVP
ncbi:hypothetical protein K523DRAFT_422342, partial [Schizophyllum commune Tattone D]